MPWIDTHCHLDASEFDTDRAAVLARARDAGVSMLVLPAVSAMTFEAVRRLAHEHGLVYALGIHPLYVDQARDADLASLSEALSRYRDDPRLVAVGEIGLDYLVPSRDPARATYFYTEQLKLAQAHELPVLLHVRRSADQLLQPLRRLAVRGIAHAFNGSVQQAEQFVALGFKLGFGGAMCFERARQIRHLATTLPAEALVLETDAPDIPPPWLYTSANDRAQGRAMGRNEPAELPRMAQTLAMLRGWTLPHTAQVCRGNALAALPRLANLLSGSEGER